MRIENSPEYEAEMKRWRKQREAKERRNQKRLAKAREECTEAKDGWLPMGKCPFAALDDEYGYDGTIVVTDGKDAALATVSRRFGTPIFWKTPPEYVVRDGMPTLIGGEEDPRDDLPKWWWKWELTDVHGSMNYAGGEEIGKDEVDFVATHWRFLPAPRTE